MELTMFETLLGLPLFLGLGHNDLTRIIEKISFNFKKMSPGEVVCQQGDPCLHMTFLLCGELLAVTESIENAFILSESCKIPGIIQPESLFGLHPTYSHSCIAGTPVNNMQIPKQAVLTNLLNYSIFRLNFLNMLCTLAQQRESLLWHRPSDTIEHKIADFLVDHSMRISGEKVLKMKMADLADYLQETRINVSKALNNLEKEHLVVLSRGIIKIPSLEQLFLVKDLPMR